MHKTQMKEVHVKRLVWFQLPEIHEKEKLEREQNSQWMSAVREKQNRQSTTDF